MNAGDKEERRRGRSLATEAEGLKSHGEIAKNGENTGTAQKQKI